MQADRNEPLSRHALAFVLAGGRGSRLMELTDRRAKPAVYFGGKSRIIDFALSNAMNSGIRRIAVATQYKAHSLIRHLQMGWNFFRPERNESFDILPASQRVSETNWYLGTADAVYQNIDIIESHGARFSRQFDYRYTWLRDASVSTAVAALLGQPEDARRYLEMVHRAWGHREMRDTPVLDVRGDPVPDQRDVAGISGWARSRPVRVGNAAGHQRQYDALGLLVEAISVYLQVGGRLDTRTWRLVTRLADGVVDEEPERVKDSNGIWEFGSARQRWKARCRHEVLRSLHRWRGTTGQSWKYTVRSSALIADPAGIFNLNRELDLGHRDPDDPEIPDGVVVGRCAIGDLRDSAEALESARRATREMSRPAGRSPPCDRARVRCRARHARTGAG